MKFRKRPVIIKAEQWFLGKYIDGVEYDEEKQPFVKTLEGNMFVNSGDWIITGVAGEKYPCKPDIFEKTYELVKSLTESDTLTEAVEDILDRIFSIYHGKHNPVDVKEKLIYINQEIEDCIDMLNKP